MSKAFGGGELLRAILESECIDSMPFWYVGLMTGGDGTGAQFKVQTTNVQTEGESYFLMTSVWGIASNAFVDQPEFMGIYDASKYKFEIFAASTYFATGLTISDPNCVFVGLQNDSLANCVTLPEYMLWGPNSLIGVTWLGRNQNPVGDTYRYLVMGGIKYHLKGGL